jgi:hypothetical protein
VAGRLTPAGETALPLAPAHTDWLRNVLSVAGPVAEVGRFAAAAAGPGAIPWVLDLDRLEEDWFLPMAAPAGGERAISLHGARILARQLRDAAAANHARMLARQGTDRRCPFDLHRLLPVPDTILRLGPDDPLSQAWLWQHWGTTRAPRQVRALPAEQDGRQRQTAQHRVEFWSADWSPWAALHRLRQLWPRLGFELRPDYRPGEATTPARSGHGARRGGAPRPTKPRAPRG